LGRTVGIGTVREQDTHDAIVRGALGSAEGVMQWRLATVGGCGVGIGALLEQELRETPVAVETGAAEAEVVAERVERRTIREQMPDGADIAVVGTVLEKRNAVCVCIRGRGWGGVAGG
jgi:hypothetical protein